MPCAAARPLVPLRFSVAYRLLLGLPSSSRRVMVPVSSGAWRAGMPRISQFGSDGFRPWQLRPDVVAPRAGPDAWRQGSWRFDNGFDCRKAGVLRSCGAFGCPAVPGADGGLRDARESSAGAARRGHVRLSVHHRPGRCGQRDRLAQRRSLHLRAGASGRSHHGAARRRSRRDGQDALCAGPRHGEGAFEVHPRPRGDGRGHELHRPRSANRSAWWARRPGRRHCPTSRT